MKLLLLKLFNSACVLLTGLVAFVVLELVMFSADLRQWQAAVPFYIVLCLIVFGVVRGLISATSDRTSQKKAP